MNNTIIFVPEYSFGEIEGYKVWKSNQSPYPIYIGFIHIQDLDNEKTRLQEEGHDVWVRDF